MEFTEFGETGREDGHVGDDFLVQEDIQNVVRHLDGIDVDGAERLEDFASTTVLLLGNPFEVVVTIVGDASVLVVTFAEMSIIVNGSRSLESEENDDMAIPISKITHFRIVISPLAVMAMSPLSSTAWRESIKYFSNSVTGEGEEMAFAIRIENGFDSPFVGNNALGEQESFPLRCASVDDARVIEIVGKPRDFNFLSFISHKTADRRDGLSPKGGAKVGIKKAPPKGSAKTLPILPKLCQNSA